MDTNSIKEEELRQSLGRTLNAEKIQLWMPPFSMENGEKGEIPEELVERLSGALNVPADTIRASIEDLRVHSVRKLACKKKFQESGIATLHVKVAGQLQQDNSASGGLSIRSPGETFLVEIDLSRSGLDLRQEVSSKLRSNQSCMRLITNGRVIDDAMSLYSQNLTNSSHLLAVCLNPAEIASVQNEDHDRAMVQQMHKAAELLSSKDEMTDKEGYYLQIMDQNGKELNLKPETRKALSLAMTLHEKAKATLKRREYGAALLLLLDSDKEFQKCNDAILDAVDNYALLCLDIVWCYLCLQNVQELPDSKRRLAKCDECFRKSYGPNLERLTLVKGGACNERALFVRLHLLQAIVAFHEQRKKDAQMLLERAEMELKVLQIDEDKLIQVMEMGFSVQEARLGLRSSDGNVLQAIQMILRKREEKAEAKQREKEEKEKKKLARKLGRTASNELVNIDHYNQLVSMGYSKGASCEALRQSNNDLLQAIQVLHDHPELLAIPDPDIRNSPMQITDEMLSQVTAMGFDVDSARVALHHVSGHVTQAIEELVKTGGTVSFKWIEEYFQTLAQNSTQSPDVEMTSEAAGKSLKTAEELAQEQQLLDTIIPDLNNDEEDHLDLTLEEESQFLQQYKMLLLTC